MVDDCYKAIGPEIAQFYGRKKLFDDFTVADVNSADISQNEKNIADILNHIWLSHSQNANEISYLENYYRGYQPILGKRKEVRPTINNIVLENNAYFVVNFKTGYVFTASDTTYSSRNSDMKIE